MSVSAVSTPAKVLVPDIPISDYLQDDPQPARRFFWQRPMETPPVTSSWGVSEEEKALVSFNSDKAARLSAIQREVGVWAMRNFGEKSLGTNPQLGIIEEVGELAKAILKKDQGIRGTPEKHDSDAVDAIGDIAIYLMNHLNVTSLDIGPLFYGAWFIRIDLVTYVSDYIPANDETRRKLFRDLSNLIPAVLDSDQRAIGHLLGYLDLLSRSYGFPSLLDVVEKTWSIVGKRNWVEDAHGGGNHTHEQS